MGATLDALDLRRLDVMSSYAGGSSVQEVTVSEFLGVAALIVTEEAFARVSERRANPPCKAEGCSFKSSFTLVLSALRDDGNAAR